MLIASRALKLRNGSDIIPIAVKIFAPEKKTDGAWACRFAIDWPDQPSDTEVFGLDSAQALFHALQFVGAEIYSSNYHKDGKLLWDTAGTGYGFPVMSGLRHLLTGDDAKYL